MDECGDVDGDVFMDEMGDIDDDAFVVQWEDDEGIMNELRLTPPRARERISWRESSPKTSHHRCLCARSTERMTNLDAVGTYIGNSKHLKHLYLHLPHLLTSANVDAMSFCRHIAINQSIESLSNDEDEAFRNLLALFEGNSSILEVNLQRQIPATAIVCLDRCQSVRALRLFDITL